MDSSIFETYLLKGYKTDWLLSYERLVHCDGLGFLSLHKLWDSFPSILFDKHAYCEIRISCLTNTFIPDFKRVILILNCWTCSLVNSEVCKLLFIANSQAFSFNATWQTCAHWNHSEWLGQGVALLAHQQGANKCTHELVKIWHWTLWLWPQFEKFETDF